VNRASRSVLAIGVGFIGATAIFRAAGIEPATTRPPEVVGEVDTFDYCRSLYGSTSNAVLIGTNAYSWRCSDRQNGLFRLVELDFDDACRERFGESARANNWNESNPYAWECVED
jgi:hypothetical protein